jgi:hypothetical protein
MKYTNLGLSDPQKGSDGHYVPLLAHIFEGYKKFDPKSDRCWPVNTTIMLKLLTMDLFPGRPKFTDAIKDLCIVAYFYLCQPGKYAHSTQAESNSSPFYLMDVHFALPHIAQICATTISLNDVP